MNTPSAKKSDVERRWFLADAEGKVLGRFASEVARILMGKHKPFYTPHVDTGDHVIVVNTGKLVVKGANKPDRKGLYELQWLSGRPENEDTQAGARDPACVRAGACHPGDVASHKAGAQDDQKGPDLRGARSSASESGARSDRPDLIFIESEASFEIR